MWPASVLSRFGAVTACRRASTWKARCPAHDDRTPSLGIWMGDNGSLIIRCFSKQAGCTLPAILHAAGLTMSDLFPPDHAHAGPHKGHTARPQRRIVATYDYTDEAGQLLYQVVRTDPKGFYQRRPDGRGGWVNGLGDTRRVLFRLPQILAAPKWPGVVVEGEKDVLALERIGLLATTAAMGAGNWIDDYARSLRGRRVVILPDNDEPGIQHAERVAGSLLVGRAESVRVVDLPGLPAKGDVSDWLTTHTREDLVAVIRGVAEYRIMGGTGIGPPSEMWQTPNPGKRVSVRCQS